MARVAKGNPASPGRPRLERPSKADLTRLYVRGRLSIRDTAATLGLSRDTTARALAEYGIARRSRVTRRGRLADMPLAVLRAGIKTEGVRGHARTLGVAASTLLEHVKREGRLKRRRQDRGGNK